MYWNDVDSPQDFVNSGRDTEEVSLAWPDPLRGPYWITLQWCVLDGRWECVGLSIDFAPGVRVRPLQTMDLRKISLSDVLDRGVSLLVGHLQDSYAVIPPTEEEQAALRDSLALLDVRREDIERRAQEIETATDYGLREGLHESLQALPQAKARERMTAERLRQVAGVYNAAREADEHPTKAVRDAFGISQSRAAQWVFRARRAGFLPPTQQGRARGRRPRERKEDA